MRKIQKYWKLIFLCVGLVTLFVAGILQWQTGSFEFFKPIAINMKDYAFQIGGYIQILCLLSFLCIGIAAFAFWKGDKQSEADRLMSIIDTIKNDNRQVLEIFREILNSRNKPNGNS